MQFFVVFVLGAVMLGAGSMLSPAWRTAQPRIALATTLCLALVVGGAVFWAELFGWDTLVIDYLLFALVSVVVLGGTLASAQMRAEAQGEELSDALQGWPGPRDLAFFALVALALVAWLAILPLPLGDSAPLSAYLALTAREGQSFHTLAPFHPEIQVVIAPGFHALTAYLSQQLQQAIPTIQAGVGALAALLIVWLGYDWGAELRDKAFGRAFALAAFVPAYGLFIMGEFAALLGMSFSFAAALYSLRAFRHGWRMDIIAGGLLLGATLYADFTVALSTFIGYGLWALWQWTRNSQPIGYTGIRTYRRVTVTWGILGVALLGLAPYLVRNLPDLLNELRRFPLVLEYLPRALYLVAFVPVSFGLGVGLMRLWDGLSAPVRQSLRGSGFLMTGGMLSLLLVGVLAFGAFEVYDSLARVAGTDVLRWAARNLPAEARVFAPEDDQRAWTASLSERDTYPFPLSTYYKVGTLPASPLQALQSLPHAEWGTEQAELLRQAGISHLFIQEPIDSDAPRLDSRLFELLHTNYWVSIYQVK